MNRIRDGYDYYYNIGGGLLSTTCPAPSCSNSFFAPVSDITVCPLMQNSGYYYYCLGSANFMVASLISADPTVTGNGLKLTYSNGQICGLSYRKAVFNLYCDQTRTVRK